MAQMLMEKIKRRLTYLNSLELKEEQSAELLVLVGNYNFLLERISVG